MKHFFGLLCAFLLFSRVAPASAEKQSEEDRVLGPAFIAKFDTNKDGKVSMSEFPETSEPFPDFYRLDKNRDGYIDKDEVPTQPAPSFENTSFLATFDTDNDGKISMSEFPESDAHFREFDKNNNCYIEENEIPTQPPPQLQIGRP